MTVVSPLGMQHCIIAHKGLLLANRVHRHQALADIPPHEADHMDVKYSITYSPHMMEKAHACGKYIQIPFA